MWTEIKVLQKLKKKKRKEGEVVRKERKGKGKYDYLRIVFKKYNDFCLY